VPINWGPLPAFSEEPLAEDAEFVVQRNFMGAIVRCRKDNPTMFYGHLEHPVRTRADWERYKERFDPATPGRVPADLETAVVPRLNASTRPVGVCLFPFFCRLGFYSLGMERFLSAFCDEPDLIHDMFEHWSRFVRAVLERALRTVRVDFAVFGEDLAGKNGPLVSPAMYRQFWGPHQTPVIDLLRARGVPLICQWTSGQFDVVLPAMIEQGFNCAWPLEWIAGMDAADLRRRYGRALRLAGNIPKEAVLAGPAAIDRELERLMPLVRAGGFIPALDDMGAPDMSYANYRHLIERLQAIRLG
jgi:uroporphyrinogen decarboxylase